MKFEPDATQPWPLPKTTDTVAIRRVRDAAVNFANQNGASIGQINAVKKALADAGYHVSR